MSDIPTTVKNEELVEKRRDQIIRAGIKLFVEKGFHKTTLRDLAQEAGLSYGNIYDYVGSKEDIFFLIHGYSAGRATAAIKEGLKGIGDPLDKLNRLLWAEFNAMDELADAIMLLYQEAHILKETYLKKLLQKEREHLEVFEEVLTEGIREGLLRECNVRVAANLIKSLIDAWVIKRWDLRGYTDRSEMQKMISDFIFGGLLLPETATIRKSANAGPLNGKTALVVNGGTILGKAVISFLHAHGIKVITYMYSNTKDRESPPISPTEFPEVTFYFADEHGPIDAGLCRTIESEVGSIDIYIHDLGTGNTQWPQSSHSHANADGQLGHNLLCAQALTGWLEERLPHKSWGRAIYIAPWGWDWFANRIEYDIVRAGTFALTTAVAKALGGCRATANCLAPGFIRSLRPSAVEKELATELADMIPLGKLGELEDITESLWFLLNDSAKHITGQVLNIAGGVEHIAEK